jgi:DHA1 family multidrug/chloramphenicol efflux transport protein-like MFS transporter
MVVGAILTSLLPYLYGNAYYYLLPGTIIYFFALSVVNAPLNRHCLFVTQVSKGTASALVSLCVMIIGAVGTEIANLFYEHHNNLLFGIYCNVLEIIFFIFTGLTFLVHKEKGAAENLQK